MVQLPLLFVLAVLYNTLSMVLFMILLLLMEFLSDKCTTVCCKLLTQSTIQQRSTLNSSLTIAMSKIKLRNNSGERVKPYSITLLVLSMKCYYGQNHLCHPVVKFVVLGKLYFFVVEKINLG